MPIQEILYWFFISVSALISLYYLFFLRFGFAKKRQSSHPNYPISVIVVGRNEAENFRKNLPKLCEQDYSNFEVVAVNDQSLDESKDVIEELQAKYPNLKLVDVAINDRFWLGKKYGLTLGIKAATHEHLLLTDADCHPASNHWIREMTSGFSSHKALVLGYGKYALNNSLVNLFIQFETVHTAIQYMTYALLGIPYMGVGRNMAYHRQLFFEKKGFVNHMHIPSGDDDLFVQEAGNAKNITIQFTRESHTISEPKKSFGTWLKQKQRHYKTSKYYKPYHKFALGLYSMLIPLFYIGVALTAVFTEYHLELLIIAGSKLLLQYLVFTLSTLKLGSYRILIFLPLLEILTWLFQVYALIASRVNKKQRW
ncbi:MAG: glycosyltransferase [Schleiferiaceae bacterium]|jgi:cellulose synthase/poly-beta-1,6-N-acetylglucosamine synthase-like glycosyltransferase|nr:glycosyltransferase [Schleiferiaceae bacterium]